MSTESQDGGKARRFIEDKFPRGLAPSPGALSTRMKPPFCRTLPYTAARPRPVPTRSPFVEKNGSKTRSSISGDMPHPVSSTVSATKSPGRLMSISLPQNITTRMPSGMPRERRRAATRPLSRASAAPRANRSTSTKCGTKNNRSSGTP